MTRDAEQRPLSHVLGMEPERIGQLGNAKSIWDNGLYATGVIQGEAVDFLVDSGSTATLISKRAFDKIDGEHTIRLIKGTIHMQGVDGKNIEVYGRAELNICFESSQINQPVIVCDITPEGILGQDFLMKHIKTWDLETLSLKTKHNAIIKLEVGGETQIVCRVLVKEKIELTSHSVTFVPVNIVDGERLASAAYVEGVKSAQSTEEQVQVVPGIMDPHIMEKGIAIMNNGEECITIHPGTTVATCNSSYEIHEATRNEYSSVQRVREIQTKPLTTEKSHTVPVHLTELFEKSSTYLDEEENFLLAELLVKYENVFSRSSGDLGQTDRVKHKINTGTAAPIRQHPRRQPFGKREIEKQEIENMLQKGVIEPSNSAWASPIVLVSKKDGTTRFCVDYRKVNDVTVKDAYPLPRVDDCLDALADAKWFSCMDLNSGFWQIAVDPDDREKTAFTTSQGLFQFRVMPFGLVNAPSSFQRLMEDVLRGLQWVESLLYMDDIITPGSTVQESLKRLENVFQRLLEANLKLKPSKCIFFQKSVNFLGHIVSEKGVHTDPNKIEAVKNWPVPRNAKHVRSFLGLASYYRKFVKGFADIARPLHKICEKNSRFAWSSECQEAFAKLKEALISSPILAYPIPEGGRFILDTDASNIAVGAVLSQEQNGQECVIAYMSKAMNTHEQSYCVTRKELLAVVTALRKFHTYLYGQEILLRTDNAAVSWMRNLKTPTGQMARWLQELSTYNLLVTHRPGRKHSNADALSRKPCSACLHQQKVNIEDEADCIDHVPDEQVDIITTEEPNSYAAIGATTRKQALNEAAMELTHNQCLLDGWDPMSLSQEQRDDPNIGLVYLALRNAKARPAWNQVSEGSAALKTLWRHWDRLEIKANMLYRRWSDGTNSESILQLIVPECKKTDVFHFFHEIPSAAHLGFDKTLEKVRHSFYWPAMTADIRRFIKTCDKCTARKLSREKNKAPLGQYLVGEPMERVAVDILGPLPLSSSGNRYALVMSDCFTKWTECVAIPNQEAKTVAQAFVNNFVCRFGAPLQLHSDQGKCFESKLFNEVCSLLDIEKTRTTSMRPQANGTVERFNRTLASMLTMYCEDNQTEWDVYIPQVMMAYRSSIHASTKITPNRMVFGREITLPLQAVIGRPSESAAIQADDYVTELQEKLTEIHEIGRLNLKKSSIYQKKQYDTRAKRKIFTAGQFVWLHDPTRKIGVCSKLKNKWKGPFLVTKTLDDLVCFVKQRPKQSAKAYHVDRLWPYEGRLAPAWMKREANKLISV